MTIKDRINVLDHGYVKLISCSGNDIDIAKSARVSYNRLDIYDKIIKEQPENTSLLPQKWPKDKIFSDKEQIEKDTKLIYALMKRKHTSPFEQIQLRFEVKAPIVVFRQWHRHRTQAYNEVSARYTELSKEFYIPDINLIGHQMKKEKQKRSTEEININANKIRDNFIEADEFAYTMYQKQLHLGCPRELARLTLNFAIYSSMVMSVSLHNWFGFIKQRMDNHAQWEIQEYARAMWQLVEKEMPISCGAFRETHKELFIDEKESK